ncbi:MAG TPA: YkvA family protein [Acidobacteriota bacterium]|nr:YkvA family protein [Acidobacteriota bacterium]
MSKLIDFVRSLAEDDRIPLRNRVVLGGLLTYLLTPIDIVPDFIPILGWLDDAFVTLIILDYIFNSADTDLILEHYPWNKDRFRKMQTYVDRLSWLIPPTVKKILFSRAERYALEKGSQDISIEKH